MGIGTGLGRAALAYEKEQELTRNRERERVMYGNESPHVVSYDEAIRGDRATQGTKDYEGFRDSIYTDSEGFETIGYGHKLTPDDFTTGRYREGISLADADTLYDTDMSKHMGEFYTNYPWASDMPGHVKEAVEDMTYNMGSSWLDKWPNTMSALKGGNYEEAANQISTSRYRKQVGQRATDNMNRIRGIY